MKTIERIKETMNKKGIKQIELANALDLGKSTINAWFNNNTDPKIEQLEKIAEALDESIEYLVTGENRQPHYTADERGIIEEYRNCDNLGKGRIREYVQEMRKLHPEQNRESETETKIS